MRWIWIDRFVEFESGRRAVAIKNVSLAEEHLHDHFPGYPIMPNSLITEGLAQTGGLLGHSFGPAVGTLFATLVTQHHTLFWFSGAFMLCGGSLVLFFVRDRLQAPAWEPASKKWATSIRPESARSLPSRSSSCSSRSRSTATMATTGMASRPTTR